MAILVVMFILTGTYERAEITNVQIKTNWWLTELHNNFSEEECKLLE